MNKLIILQSPTELDYALNNLDLKNSIIVASNHTVFYECQKNNIDALSFDNYFERKKYVDKRPHTCSENNVWIKQLDSYIQENISEFKKEKLSPARFNILGLYGFLDELNFSFNVISNFFINEDFDEVYLSKPKKFTYGTWSRVYPRASIIPICFEEIARQKGKKIKRIDDGDESFIEDETTKQQTILQKIAKHINPNHKRVFKLFLRYGFSFLVNFYKSKILSSRRVLVFGGAYDLSKLIKILVDNNICVDISESPEQDFYSQKEFLRVRKKIKNVVQNNSFPKSLLYPFKDYPYQIPNYLMETIINRFLTEMLPIFWSSYYSFKKVNTEKYSLVLFWALGEGVYPFMNHLAKKKTKTAIFQHGGGPRQMLMTNYYQEVCLSDYFFSYGDGINKIFKNLSKYADIDNKKHAECISLGALRVSEIKILKNAKKINQLRENIKKRLNSERIILFVPHLYHYPSCYLNDSLLHGINYFIFHQKVINLFSNYKDIGFVYKGFASDLDIMKGSPIKDYIDQKKFSNILYTSEFNLDSLIFATDEIVVDHNATSLNEIMQTDKNILLFDQGETNPWNIGHDARKLIEENVHISKDYDDFFDMLDKLINQKLHKKNINYSSNYFQEYCHINEDENAFEVEVYNKINKII